ncbi:ABC transporter substrate-binding protein [Anaerospora sp.]|jgi:iron complex transport system substrate-binding protein|uniref:ABC transporter substrate-binding protein n=1 Tax=Anaerospora sp. TaxID=1960278 RepID=UPI002897B65B|nr:ABC transporter substrate-binding protein [Anaerospora sp.]
MKRKTLILLAGIMLVILSGCSQEKETKAVVKNTGQVRTVQYLGKEYTVPAGIERIVITGALESLEDAVLLNVQPVGAMTVGGSFPAILASITQKTVPIGEQKQPNFEAILKLAPDIILGSDKFPAGTAAQLQKIAPTIPVSHIATAGEANLLLLADLTGKQSVAEEILQKYHEQVKQIQAQLQENVKGKKVIAVRFRAGNINIYPEDVFFNEILYKELGLVVPAEIKAAKAQEILSLEKLSEMNPDVIFLQYAAGENLAQPKGLQDLQQNAIWNNLQAVKNKQVFVNVVDPLIQGVAIGGKQQFLQAIAATLQ